MSQTHFSTSLPLVLLLCVWLSQADTMCEDEQNHMRCISTLNAITVEDLMEQPEDNCENTKFIPRGETVDLECQAPNEITVYVLGWEFYPSSSPDTRVEVVIDNERFINDTETDRLVIRDIQPEDEGLYTCRIRKGGDVVVAIAGCVIIHAITDLVSDTREYVNGTIGGNVTLPTALNYNFNGFCGVLPIVRTVQLRHNNTNIYDCDEDMPTCESKIGPIQYDFAALGDMIIPSSVVNEGEYIYGLSQDCPSSIIRVSYQVSFTSPDVIISTSAPTQGSITPSVPPPTNSSNNDAIKIAVPIVVILTLLILAAVLIVGSFILYKRRESGLLTISRSKEPVYEIPAMPHITRDDSDYTLPPSSLGGEKNGRGPYEEHDVYLHEKPTDQEGFI